MSALAAWSEHIAPDGRPYYHNHITGESSWIRPPSLLLFAPAHEPARQTRSVSSLHQPLMASAPAMMIMPSASFVPSASGGYLVNDSALSSPFGMMGNFPGLVLAPPMIGPGPPIQKGRTASGPPGSNLFIFHIPNDMSNRNLFDLFNPYGNVISARIMVERETGRSRGFGFVSFDSPISAENAVRAMDGFNVGRKRLKVALKRENASIPSMVDGGALSSQNPSISADGGDDGRHLGSAASSDMGWAASEIPGPSAGKAVASFNPV